MVNNSKNKANSYAFTRCILELQKLTNIKLLDWNEFLVVLTDKIEIK